MAKRLTTPAAKAASARNAANLDPSLRPVPLWPQDPNAFIIRLLGIVLLSILIYIPNFNAHWIWDDDQLITRNPAIQRGDGFFSAESWKGFGELWAPKDASVSSDYFPLTATTFWIEWRLWGNDEKEALPKDRGIGAAGYHITNVLLHALCAVLLWRVLERLKIPGAWLAALIWAVHPVCVESVAWVSERKNTLSMVFYLLTFLSWLKWRDFGRAKHYWFSVIYFLLALLSKTSVVPLPVILLMIVWWKDQKITFEDFKATVPHFVLALILGAVTVHFQSGRAVGEEYIPIGGAMRQLAEAAQAEGKPWLGAAYSYFGRLGGASLAIGFYIWKCLIPVQFRYQQPYVDPHEVTSFRYFNPEWPHENLRSIGDFFIDPPQNALGPRADLILIYPQWHETIALWQQFIPGLLVLAIFAIAWVYRATWGKHLILGLGSFVLTLMPVLGMLKMSYMRLTLVADHFQYLSMPGLIALVVAFFIFLKDKYPLPKVAAAAAGAMVVFSLAWASFFYAQIFDGMNSLWTDTLIKNRNTWQANNHMGALLFREGRSEQALYHFLRGVELKPYNCEVQNNAGLAYSALGYQEKALYHFAEAVRIKADDPSIRTNYANALLSASRFDEAIEQYQEALGVLQKVMSRVPIYRNPNALPIYVNLSACYLQKGRFFEAAEACKNALRIDPNSNEARRNLEHAQLRLRAATRRSATPQETPAPRKQN